MMFLRYASVVAVFAAGSIGFAQDQASLPAWGFKDSFQISQIKNAATLTLPVISITNAGMHNVAPGNGSICASVYTFDSSTAALTSCCACLVAPNQGKAIVGASLPAAAAIGTQIVKLLATVPSPTIPCDPRTSSYGGNGQPGGYAAGMSAIATRPQMIGIPFTTDVTFTPAPLSSGELTRIANACSTAIAANTANACVCQ